MSSDSVGAYALQAAIAAVHASAPDFAATDWAQIVGLYDLLMHVTPSPVVEINRAGAVAMRDGPAAGLLLVDAILARGDLVNYSLAHATRAELCRRLGKAGEAQASYHRALALAQQEPERRFLERQLAKLADQTGNEFTESPSRLSKLPSPKRLSIETNKPEPGETVRPAPK
jgi:RNA polymerase sigma-70 factor (ECF subfamily)